ncbi:hypothetical protein TA3x_001022 [Tundrisphaera sp. TA3]|uniref:hypothetical protein n=1 Tax=Tundrisphaera sp. TA3 TaxID=3435775 RepID=UPI003EBFE0AD
MRQTDCTPPSSWQVLFGPGTAVFTTPGTFEIRAVFTFQAISDPNLNPNPPAPEPKTKTVTIAPPEIDHVEGTGVLANMATQVPGPTAGNPTSTSNGGEPGYWINFILKSNNKTIGPYFNGTVQERITNARNATFTLVTEDSGWIPANGNHTSFFLGMPVLTNNYGPPYSNTYDLAICDFKCAVQQPGNPVGRFGSYTQKNRITWADANGNPVSKELNPSYDFVITSTGTQTSIAF